MVMNQKLVNALRLLFALFCILFGANKFLELFPTCSLISHITSKGMMVLGILEITLGVALVYNQHTLLLARLGTAIIIGGFIMHIVKGTNDYGGAIIEATMGLFLIFTLKKRNK